MRNFSFADHEVLTANSGNKLKNVSHEFSAI